MFSNTHQPKPRMSLGWAMILRFAQGDTRPAGFLCRALTVQPVAIESEVRCTMASSTQAIPCMTCRPFAALRVTIGDSRQALRFAQGDNWGQQTGLRFAQGDNREQQHE